MANPRDQLTPRQHGLNEASLLDQQVLKEHPWILNLIIVIIRLRRNLNVPKNVRLFKEIINENFDDLHFLNPRWVSSVLDTFVDHGTDQEKYEAMIVNSYHLQERMVTIAFKIFKGEKAKFGKSDYNDKLTDNLHRAERTIRTPLFRKLLAITLKAEVVEHHLVKLITTKSRRFFEILERMEGPWAEKKQ